MNEIDEMKAVIYERSLMWENEKGRWFSWVWGKVAERNKESMERADNLFSYNVAREQYREALWHSIASLSPIWFRHSCPDWDYLVIDSRHEEFSCCHCYDKEAREIRKSAFSYTLPEEKERYERDLEEMQERGVYEVSSIFYIMPKDYKLVFGWEGSNLR